MLHEISRWRLVHPGSSSCLSILGRREEGGGVGIGIYIDLKGGGKGREGVGFLSFFILGEIDIHIPPIKRTKDGKREGRKSVPLDN